MPMTASSTFAVTAPAKGHGLRESVRDPQLKLKVNEAKSAVAQPEERKFLGFSVLQRHIERRAS
jgi:hypothetical protein